MEAYSDDLRERVVEAYGKGAGSLRELAELFGVSHACSIGLKSRGSRYSESARRSRRAGRSNPLRIRPQGRMAGE